MSTQNGLKAKAYLSSAFNGFKMRIFDGLVVLVPIAVLLVVVGFIFNFGVRIAGICVYPFYQASETSPLWVRLLVHYIIPVVAVAGALIGVSVVGTAWRTRAIKYVMAQVDTLVISVPAVGAIYKTTRQLVKQLLKGNEGGGGEQIVWIKDCSGRWELAQVIKECPNGMCFVYQPMALNITNGYTFLISKTLTHPSSATFAEMLEWYASGGFSWAESIEREANEMNLAAVNTAASAKEAQAEVKAQ